MAWQSEWAFHWPWRVDFRAIQETDLGQKVSSQPWCCSWLWLPRYSPQILQQQQENQKENERKKKAFCFSSVKNKREIQNRKEKNSPPPPSSSSWIRVGRTNTAAAGSSSSISTVYWTINWCPCCLLTSRKLVSLLLVLLVSALGSRE